MIDTDVIDGVGEAPEIEPEAGPEDPAARRKRRLLQLGGLALAIVITVSVYLMRDRLRDAASYGYVGLFFISMLGNATIVLPVPTLLTAFLGGSVYNPVLVGIISAAGATIGELTGYLAGLGGQAIVEKRGMYDRFLGWMERYGIFALFVLAAIPNPFFDVAGIIAGMSKMKVWTYLLVTWAGKIVKFILIAYLGAGSIGLFDRWFGPN